MVAIAFAIPRAKIFAIAVPITPKHVPNSQRRKRHNKPQPPSQLSPQPKSQKILVRLRSKMNHGFLINYLKVSKISLMKNLENQLNIKILLIGWKIQDFIFWMQNTIAGLTRNVRSKNSLNIREIKTVHFRRWVVHSWRLVVHFCCQFLVGNFERNHMSVSQIKAKWKIMMEYLKKLKILKRNSLIVQMQLLKDSKNISNLIITAHR